MSTIARNPSRHRNNAPAAAAAASSPPSSSTSSPSSASSSSSSSTESASPSTDLRDSNEAGCTQEYLINCKSLYSCIHCRTHLANHDELVSRSFQGNHGRAYLFNSVINISCGPAVQRQLNTGSHAVADIFCANCERTLGWKYEKAYVETQKYKEGKYIIELAHVVRENRHLELDKGEIFLSRQLSRSKYGKHNTSTTTTGRPFSSYSSSSSSQLSSPTDSALGADSPLSQHDDHDDGGRSRYDDEDDEELMFPFYDDLCASRSSYPGNLSMSHHDRARRSLYLESKPYDWKNSPPTVSSSSCSPRLRSAGTSTNSSAAPTSDDRPPGAPTSSLSPSTSSTAALASAAAAPLQCCHADDDGERDDMADDDDDDVAEDVSRQTEPVSSPSFKANKRPKHNHNDILDDSETQFKLEDDLQQQQPQPPSAQRAEVALNQRRRISAPADDTPQGSTTSSSSAEQARPADNNQPSSSSSGRHTINLDDEEFFDCYSEHDVLNSSINWPDLKPSRASYAS